MAIALQRLKEERKNWRREKPFGFYARPVLDSQGVATMTWEAGIPGKENTPWEGGEYKLRLEFSKDFPSKPPKVQFTPVIFHPNVYPTGTVCLSILNEEKGWKASITVKQILLSIQELLDNPNVKDPAQKDPYELYVRDKPGYEQRVREEAKKHAKRFTD